MIFNLGIDIGSTTVKTVLTDENNKILYKSYDRHMSKTRETAAAKLRDIINSVGNVQVRAAVTGSAGLGVAQKLDIPFVQEVFAVTAFVKDFYPDISAAIELGGEDAKIIFFEGAAEERMNSTCAGGTGAFIDQMASLLNVSSDELDALSLKADALYPIASRCGVFAKTDIQPLINQGASKANIAASIYKSVVDQTITGLAQGRPIRGRVLFLGGPLSFSQGLRQSFVHTLPDISPVFPPMAEYFVAFGAAHFASKSDKPRQLAELAGKLEKICGEADGFASEKPLFENAAEYEEFVARHNKSKIEFCDEYDPESEYYLGIDAGSTTTKAVLTDKNCRILFSDYRQNKGNPIEIVKAQLEALYSKYPDLKISASAVTGYGEDLIKNAFKTDLGIVETSAHYAAARHFDPQVDFIIDIGGQDMKCFGIKNNMVDSLIINEACSSGCGSFIETFAASLGYTAGEFAALAVKAAHPADLGSRCTVFMNSAVKQAQKNGACVEDIAAGLAISVVKNAIFKVLRVSDPASLGQRIVVQGGTFKNDAVLRAFERLLGVTVVRPNIAGLMGAFGCALTAMRSGISQSTILCGRELQSFSHSSSFTHCGLCTNKCALTINKFSDGRRFISGNRCERPTGKASGAAALPNLYKFKQDYLAGFNSFDGQRKITVGLPLALNFYDVMPFWFTFFSRLGFSVRVSEPSSRALYRKGQHTIPSDTVCYGAKLAHGHVFSLIEKRVDAIFYPQSSYNFDQGISDNCFHCPVVAYYPEVIKNNIPDLDRVKFIDPFVALNDSALLARQLKDALEPLDSSIRLSEIKSALKEAYSALDRYRAAVLEQGRLAVEYAREHGLRTIVLAGRPYHTDVEINHGIDKLICSLGFVVISEDALPLTSPYKKLGVLNQWTYHARMYSAAQTVCSMPDTELVQLVSFGCGLDAVTTDEIRRILTDGGKLYTQIKIDEINNLGAVKIRIRSLLAAMNEREGILNANKR